MKVFSKPTARLSFLHTLGTQDGLRKWVGWDVDMTKGIYDKKTGKFHGITVLKLTPTEVPPTNYYINAVKKDKDLIAADLETAQICGVPFDPSLFPEGAKV